MLVKNTQIVESTLNSGNKRQKRSMNASGIDLDDQMIAESDLHGWFNTRPSRKRRRPKLLSSISVDFQN
jgi:hypothetical protein